MPPPPIRPSRSVPACQFSWAVREAAKSTEAGGGGRHESVVWFFTQFQSLWCERGSKKVERRAVSHPHLALARWPSGVRLCGGGIGATSPRRADGSCRPDLADEQVGLPEPRQRPRGCRIAFVEKRDRMVLQPMGVSAGCTYTIHIWLPARPLVPPGGRLTFVCATLRWVPPGVSPPLFYMRKKTGQNKMTQTARGPNAQTSATDTAGRQGSEPGVLAGPGQPVEVALRVGNWPLGRPPLRARPRATDLCVVAFAATPPAHTAGGSTPRAATCRCTRGVRRRGWPPFAPARSSPPAVACAATPSAPLPSPPAPSPRPRRRPPAPRPRGLCDDHLPPRCSIRRSVCAPRAPSLHLPATGTRVRGAPSHRR